MTGTGRCAGRTATARRARSPTRNSSTRSPTCATVATTRTVNSFDVPSPEFPRHPTSPTPSKLIAWSTRCTARQPTTDTRFESVVTELSIVEIAARDTYPLRLDVLRNDTPSQDVAFDVDDLPG